MHGGVAFSHAGGVELRPSSQRIYFFGTILFVPWNGGDVNRHFLKRHQPFLKSLTLIKHIHLIIKLWFQRITSFNETNRKAMCIACTHINKEKKWIKQLIIALLNADNSIKVRPFFLHILACSTKNITQDSQGTILNQPLSLGKVETFSISSVKCSYMSDATASVLLPY